MMVGSRARIPVYRDSGSVNFNAIFKAKEGTVRFILSMRSLPAKQDVLTYI